MGLRVVLLLTCVFSLFFFFLGGGGGGGGRVWGRVLRVCFVILGGVWGFGFLGFGLLKRRLHRQYEEEAARGEGPLKVEGWAVPPSTNSP